MQLLLVRGLKSAKAWEMANWIGRLQIQCIDNEDSLIIW